MGIHEQTYRSALKLSRGSRILCELNGTGAKGIYKLIPDGPIAIENLMALAQSQTYRLGKGIHIWNLLSHHRMELRIRRISFDEAWIQEQMDRHKFNTKHDRL